MTSKLLKFGLVFKAQVLNLGKIQTVVAEIFHFCTGYSQKKGIFYFISQVSNDFQQILCVPPDNLVHCGYFEYNRFSDNEK
jgi:hypothetical protein